MADLLTRAMTARDVEEYVHANKEPVYRLARRGELQGFKVACAWRFQFLDFDEWIDLKKWTSFTSRDNK